MIWYSALIKILAAFVAAISQILLKKSTLLKHDDIVLEYLNWHVVTAYILFFLTVFLNIYAFARGLEYRFGSVLNATAYLFTMVLSVLLLHDKLNWRCVCGNLLIFIGIVIYVVF